MGGRVAALVFALRFSIRFPPLLRMDRNHSDAELKRLEKVFQKPLPRCGNGVFFYLPTGCGVSGEARTASFSFAGGKEGTLKLPGTGPKVFFAGKGHRKGWRCRGTAEGGLPVRITRRPFCREKGIRQQESVFRYLYRIAARIVKKFENAGENQKDCSGRFVGKGAELQHLAAKGVGDGVRKGYVLPDCANERAPLPGLKSSLFPDQC